MLVTRARTAFAPITLFALLLTIALIGGMGITALAATTPSEPGDAAARADGERDENEGPGRGRPADAGRPADPGTPDHAGTPEHAGGPGDEGEAAPFLVGTGSALTNPDEQICIGGYGTFCTRPHEGIRDDLTARALAITEADTGDTFVLLTGTAVGLFAKYKPEFGDNGTYDVRQRLSEMTGVPAGNVVVSSDHSHAAPDTIGIWGGVDEHYMNILADGLVAAGVQAVATRTPAHLSVAAFDARTLDASFALDGNYRDAPTDDSAMDNEFRVLFADSPSGTRLATYTNYAPHATACSACNDELSGDWPEWAAYLSEDMFGGHGIATVGALGATDFGKSGGVEKQVSDSKARLSALLTHAADIAVPVSGNDVAVETVFIHEQMAQPILAANYLPGIPSPSTVGIPYGDNGDISIDRSIDPPFLVGGNVGTYTTTARIGDVFISTFPGEPFPQLQDALRASVQGARAHFLIGSAQDFLGYMVADDETYQQTFEEGATYLGGCPEHELYDGLGQDHDGACKDHWTLMVSPTIGRHIVCTIQNAAAEIGFTVSGTADECAALTATDGLGAPAERPGGDPIRLPDTTTRAGVASVDASWHLGASGGQFSEHQIPPGSSGFPGEELLDGEPPSGGPQVEYVDPFLHAKRKRPARGIQSRIVTRAMVVEGVNGERVAIVGNDLYLPQDLLNRRVAQLLEQHDLAVMAEELSPVTSGSHTEPTGIGEGNLGITVSHNHNSAFYSTPSWGVWVFQDVFDVRFFEYMAQRMATAVIDAVDELRPVRIGAATVPFNEIQAHTIGPKTADDGTPASQPFSHTTGMMTLVRVDDVSDPGDPQPYAAWVTLGLHPEWTWGYELFSGDITHAAMRIIDRELGVTTVMSQRETGASGPHKDLRVHEPEDRREFQESGWQQLDVGARLWADKVHEAWDAIADNEQPEPFDPHFPRTEGAPVELVPLGSDLDVASTSMRFAPPWTRPVPGISNCNTASLFHGDWRVPVLGLPDCNDDAAEIGGPVVDSTPIEEREFYDQLKAAGVPIPESYTGTKFTGVEETAAVHLMAMRIGDIGITFCPCEQFTDTAHNIRTRLDVHDDNVWRGWDWTTQSVPSAGHPDGRDFCVQNDDTTWTCADAAQGWRLADGEPWPDLAPITDLEYRRMKAQINNDADGWEELANAGTHLGGEAEPADPDRIKGNYTHREIDEYGAAEGYGLTIAVGMANDYFGYTPSYRDMRAFDHYRKALNGLGLHGSDYLATRLVRLASSLKGGEPVELGPLDVAYQAESARARATSQMVGELARAHVASYDAALPPDGGTPAITEQPTDVERFDGAVVRFVGGSSYTDLPYVTVERLVDGDWIPFADQMGEIQTEVEFPTPEDLPAFQTGEFVWEWTAAFETYVSQVPLPDATGTIREVTPAGTYRFVIDGEHRTQFGDQVEPYHLESEPFEVRPWDGLTVDALEFGDDLVKLRIGPTTTEVFGAREWTFGQIDYPNGWAWDEAIASVADKRSLTEKGDHGEHGERVFYRYRDGAADDQPYCLFCRFHPWLDTGAPSFARVTVTRRNGETTRHTAVPVGDELWAQVKLRPHDVVTVDAGSVFDAWGNTNADPVSATVPPPGR